jgi:AMP-binding enzyme
MEPSLDVTSLYNRRAVNRWERTSVGDLTERVTWSYPDKEAVIAAAGACADPRFARVTYRQADQAANQVANALLACGLRRGDIVMLFCENSVEGLLFKLGAAKAGLVCAPLNPMMAPDMVAAMVDLVRPKLAVVDAELWPRAEQPFGERGLPVAVTITIGGEAVAGSVSFSDFIAGQSDAEPEAEIHGDDISSPTPSRRPSAARSSSTSCVPSTPPTTPGAPGEPRPPPGPAWYPSLVERGPGIDDCYPGFHEVFNVPRGQGCPVGPADGGNEGVEALDRQPQMRAPDHHRPEAGGRAGISMPSISRRG